MRFVSRRSTRRHPHPSPPPQAGEGVLAVAWKEWLPQRKCIPSPALALSDSHIFQPECGAVFDALEVVETLAHHSRAWFSVVSGPAAETTNDPTCKGKRASGVRVFLPLCLAFDLRRYGFEDRLVGRIESIGEALASRAVAGFDQLHHGDSGHGRRGDELDHAQVICNVGHIA